MKILCNYTPSGPSYVRGGWGRALKAAGHEFKFWKPETKSAMDAFNEFEPDIYLGTTYDVDRAIYKCIAARPNLKVGLFASAWGPRIDEIDLQKYPIIVATEQEKRLIEKLKVETGRPDFVFIHVTDKYLEPTMSGWRSIGVTPIGVLNAADIIHYHPADPIDALKCDVGFVGGWWPYKSRNLKEWILPLCHPSEGLDVKIFSNSRWPVANQLGTISDANVKHLFNSATVCPNVSEPHSTDSVCGWDIVERPYKIMSSGGFCVSDFVDEAQEVFTKDELLMVTTPTELKEVIHHYVENPEERASIIARGCKRVLTSNTYFDRVAQFMMNFGLPEEAANIIDTKWKMVHVLYSNTPHLLPDTGPCPAAASQASPG